MAFFPMTFPFYFEDTAIVYPPFRPLAPETLRDIGTTLEDPRTFLDPSFPHRIPDTVSARTFDSHSSGRVFGSHSVADREFDDSDSSPSRVFGTDPSSPRSFDDDSHVGRS